MHLYNEFHIAEEPRGAEEAKRKAQALLEEQRTEEAIQEKKRLFFKDLREALDVSYTEQLKAVLRQSELVPGLTLL